MTTIMEELLDRYRVELEQYRKSLALKEGGVRYVGEKTAEHLQWPDATHVSIAHSKRVIAEYGEILERHKKQI